MRLLVAVLTLVLLIIIDQSQLRGHYTAETARLLRYALAQVGL